MEGAAAEDDVLPRGAVVILASGFRVLHDALCEVGVADDGVGEGPGMAAPVEVMVEHAHAREEPLLREGAEVGWTQAVLEVDDGRSIGKDM